MELNKLLETARKYAEDIRNEKPGYADKYAAFLVNDKDEIFLGVSGLTIRDGKIVNVPADVNAVLNMANAGSRIATGLVIISIKTGGVLKPSEDGLHQLFRTNANNDNCKAFVSETEQQIVSVLRLGGGNAASLMDGFDFGGPVPGLKRQAAPEVPSVMKVEERPAHPESTANSIKGVNVDKNNPFYENSENVKPPEQTLAIFEDVKNEAGKIPAPKDDLPEEPELTPEELLKQAKKRKKVARSNFLFRRKQ